MEKILTKEEMKIIGLFRNNITSGYTIKEISEKIKKKSYNWVFNAVSKMRDLEILKVVTKGHSNFCYINMDNNLTLIYLSLSEQEKINEKFPLKNIYRLINSIPLAYFSFLITGSYSEGKQASKSDLDIVVIVENQEDVKKVLTILKNKGDLMIPQVHSFVFSREEFLKMLVEKEENYGKEIFRKHIIFFGTESYYLILKEAIDHGFKG